MNNQGQAAGQQEDYVDKGLDAVEKKFGQGKIDPAKQRSMNEKITDKARDMFEKATGKNVPDKTVEVRSTMPKELGHKAPEKNG